MAGWTRRSYQSMRGGRHVGVGDRWSAGILAPSSSRAVRPGNQEVSDRPSWCRGIERWRRRGRPMQRCRLRAFARRRSLLVARFASDATSARRPIRCASAHAHGAVSCSPFGAPDARCVRCRLRCFAHAPTGALALLLASAFASDAHDADSRFLERRRLGDRDADPRFDGGAVDPMAALLGSVTR